MLNKLENSVRFKIPSPKIHENKEIEVVGVLIYNNEKINRCKVQYVLNGEIEYRIMDSNRILI